MTMHIGVPRERLAGETRVAATPRTVEQLSALGYDVIVEEGAGALSSFPDDAYAAAGASIGDLDEVWAADVVFKVNAPDAAEIERLHEGVTLVSLLAPGLNPELVETLAAKPITALAMDAVPRISRAQSLDVLSSMANIAGAGVAGLAAIGAASSLGAIVYATDPRPEVADQVKSLGGEFLTVQSAEAEVSSSGYAKEMSQDYNALAAQLYAAQAPEVDIIVTTALIPGRPAPRLITADMVASMKSGSVIVDMAAAQGGNVEGTRAGEVVVTGNGVTIIGYTDLAGRLPAQASQLYGTNLVNLMKLLTPAKDGEVVLDFDDVVQRGITVVHRGEKMWPPPPVQVSAAPAAAAAAPVKAAPEKKKMSNTRKLTLTGIGIAALWLVNAFAPQPLPEHFTVLMLATVIGYYVIGKVHHALHTPLMSVTNAISGIIVVGALLQIGNGSTVIRVLSFVAILLASINIFGGFAVTRRMLGMFSKG
jgi:NAD(P) transhydrogenase subunit alpha